MTGSASSINPSVILRQTHTPWSGLSGDVGIAVWLGQPSDKLDGRVSLRLSIPRSGGNLADIAIDPAHAARVSRVSGIRLTDCDTQGIATTGYFAA